MHTHTHTHACMHICTHTCTHTVTVTHAHTDAILGTQTHPGSHTCGQFKLGGRGHLHRAWVDVATSVSELWHKKIELKHRVNKIKGN